MYRSLADFAPEKLADNQKTCHSTRQERKKLVRPIYTVAIFLARSVYKSEKGSPASLQGETVNCVMFNDFTLSSTDDWLFFLFTINTAAKVVITQRMKR